MGCLRTPVWRILLEEFITKGKELKDIRLKTDTIFEAKSYRPRNEGVKMELCSNRPAVMLLPKTVAEKSVAIGKELKDIRLKTDTIFEAKGYRLLNKGVKMELCSNRPAVMLLPKTVAEKSVAIGKRLKLIFVKTDTKFEANSYRPLYEGVKKEPFLKRLAEMLLQKNVPEEFFAIGKRLKLIFVKTEIVEQKMLKSGAMPDNTGIGGGIVFVMYCIYTDD